MQTNLLIPMEIEDEENVFQLAEESRSRVETEIKRSNSQETDEEENFNEIEQLYDDQVVEEQKPDNCSATGTKQRNNSAVNPKFEDNQVQ